MASDLTAAPVIELGGDFEPASSMDAAGGGGRRGRRLLAAAAIAVLALASLGASAARPTPAIWRVATVTAAAGGTFMKIGSKIIVADVRDGHNAMTAYSLPSGRRLWSTMLTVLAAGLSLERHGDLVIASLHNAYVSGDLTDAVDLRTGAMVWRHPGELTKVFPGAGGALMMDAIPARGGGVWRITMTDIATGAARWGRDWPIDCLTSVAAHLVVACPAAGALDLVDPISGRLVGERSVDFGFSHRHPDMRPSYWIKLAEQDGVVIMTRITDSGFQMDAYSTSGLAHLWRMPFSGAGSDSASPRDRIMLMSGTRAHGGGMAPEFRDGVSIPVPGASQADSWITSVTAHGPSLRPAAPPLRLSGVSAQSCVLVRPYLACAVDRTHLAFYDVSALAGVDVGGAG